MKGFFSLLALPALILPALASTAVVKRQDVFSELLSDLETVVSDVEPVLVDLVDAGFTVPDLLGYLADELEGELVSLAESSKKSKREPVITARQSDAATAALAELSALATDLEDVLVQIVDAGFTLPDALGDLSDELEGELVSLYNELS